jgi:RNA 2',3'-cyclic 3'-phosphodiesterase
MRLFIAISLPDDWKQILTQAEASIGWLGHGVRWVEPHGMHLTLRFLGEVTEAQLPAVTSSITDACHGIVPFAMRIKGTGVFPHAKKPRIYWAGLEAPAVLLDLQTRIEERMTNLGYEPDANPFRPHLTLARIKDPMGKQRMTDALLDYKMESAPVMVSEILLIRSHLSSDGARYETLHRFPLAE